MASPIEILFAAAEALGAVLSRPKDIAKISIAKLMILAGMGGVVGFCFLGAICCGLHALWLFEAPLVGQIGASLILAGLLIAIAAGAFIWLWILLAPHRAPSPSDPDLLVREATSLIQSHKGIAVGVALTAGLLAGLAGAKPRPNSLSDHHP